MEVLKQNKFFICLFLISFLGFSIDAADLRVVVDVPMEISKIFFGVEKYILQGYRSQHIFGINHHIKNAIKEENAKRVAQKQKMLNCRFSIDAQKNIYITLCYIGDLNTQNNIDDVKKALQDAVNSYKSDDFKTQLAFKALPKAYFIQRGANELLVIQNITLTKGADEVSNLMKIIKNLFDERNIDLQFLQMGAHVNFAQIKSDNSQIIQLIKNDKNTLEHLASVEPQKGTDKGFDVKSLIHLYDGSKRLATYSLIGD